jgi:hypothetical protein
VKRALVCTGAVVATGLLGAVYVGFEIVRVIDARRWVWG